MTSKKFQNFKCYSLLLLSSICFVYCSSEHKKIKENFSTLVSKIENKNLSIRIDTLSTNFNYSGDGIVKVLGDTLVFIDELFKTIHFFNSNNFLLINKFEYMEKLNQTNIFGQPIFFEYHNNGYILMNGRKLTFFDKNMNIDTTVKLKFRKTKPTESLLDKPDPVSMDMYEINYEKRRSFANNGMVLITLNSEHPSFNPFTSKDYFEQATSFGVVNLNTNTVTSSNIFKSSAYQDSCCFPTTDWASVVANTKKEFIVQHAMDTNIYIYNSKQQPILKYGIANNLIPTSVKSNNLDIAFDFDKYKDEVAKTAVFDNIFYIDSLDLTIRVFIDNKNSKQILQLYQKFNLIKEFEIGYDLELVGTNTNYLFAKFKNSTKICKLKFIL